MKNNDETLHQEIEARMREKAFTCNLDSILKVVMTNVEYEKWAIMSEKERLKSECQKPEAACHELKVKNKLKGHKI